MPLVKTFKTRAGYLLLRSLSLICQPRWPWFPGWLGIFLGDLVYLISWKFRRVALSNLRFAFSSEKSEDEIRNICRSNFRLFVKNLLEFLASPRLTQEELRRRVVLQGEDILWKALKEGKGAILLTAHFGNWEWMGARIAAEGLPLTVIARPHNDSATNTLIDSIRQRNGMVVISREDVRSALRTLRNNQILGILPDQHAGRSGIPILFFGRPASTFPGIAALAIRSGAPIIPGFAVRQPDGTHLVTISPPLKLLSGNDSQETVRSNTTLCTKVIEEQIKLHPDHWLWFHNRWKS